MRALRLKTDVYEPEVLPYLSDCQRLQKVLAENGYEATIKQCFDLWTTYSDTFAAGWLLMPESDLLLFLYVQDYIAD